MEIRKTRTEEIDVLMNIYAQARAFMQQTGNASQWTGGYPSRERIELDIEEGYSYVCLYKGEIVGTFYFKQGEESTYVNIYEGKWLNDKPYGVVHRIASSGKIKGIGIYCLEWCYGQCRNMRIDTHRENRVMQNILEKLNYKSCGIIYIEDSSPRIAYQKCDEPITTSGQ